MTCNRQTWFGDSHNDFQCAAVKNDPGFGDSWLSWDDLRVVILERWFSMYDHESGDSCDNLQ